jgi:hypothetical protein
MKITKRTVDAMAIGDVLRDDEVTGFRARRLPSGKVTFRYTHKVTGQRREASLGLYGNITPDEARAILRRMAQDRSTLSGLLTEARRFPPPWTVEELTECFVVRDANRHALGLRFGKSECWSPRCRFTSGPFRARGGVEGYCLSAGTG